MAYRLAVALTASSISMTSSSSLSFSLLGTDRLSAYRASVGPSLPSGSAVHLGAGVNLTTFVDGISLFSRIALTLYFVSFLFPPFLCALELSGLSFLRFPHPW